MVLITVYEGLEKRAAAVGVYDVLLKPHLEESVVTRVEAAMAAAREARTSVIPLRDRPLRCEPEFRVEPRACIPSSSPPRR